MGDEVLANVNHCAGLARVRVELRAMIIINRDLCDIVIV